MSVAVSSRRKQALRLILGKKTACEGMGVVEINATRKPDTSGVQEFSAHEGISSSNLLSKEQVKEMFPNVFYEKALVY